MKLKLGYKEMVRRAEAEIKTIDVAEAMRLLSGDAAVFVDLRDIRELYREGKIPKAKHVPRGMLEFWIDPDSPYHKPFFLEKQKIVFYCNLGWRSALASQLAQQMGLEDVCHMAGGFDAWKAAGGAVEPVEKR
ncbi:MAG: rhodanese-like domain-containing protein [Deltaproteobacteria bacterium]|jgi:rhodanese-related sulfurtransferase|nr:rhodanese-like domain-containing protein [Deltaproteobacteria bacterium]